MVNWALGDPYGICVFESSISRRRSCGSLVRHLVGSDSFWLILSRCRDGCVLLPTASRSLSPSKLDGNCSDLFMSAVMVDSLHQVRRTSDMDITYKLELANRVPLKRATATKGKFTRGWGSSTCDLTGIHLRPYPFSKILSSDRQCWHSESALPWHWCSPIVRLRVCRAGFVSLPISYS